MDRRLGRPLPTNYLIQRGPILLRNSFPPKGVYGIKPSFRDYSVQKGTFPRVTHPSAAKPEGFARLACVRPAASVRSEPGSNSQVEKHFTRLSLTFEPLHIHPGRLGPDESSVCMCFSTKGTEEPYKTVKLTPHHRTTSPSGAIYRQSIRRKRTKPPTYLFSHTTMSKSKETKIKPKALNHIQRQPPVYLLVVSDRSEFLATRSGVLWRTADPRKPFFRETTKKLWRPSRLPFEQAVCTLRGALPRSVIG